MSTVYTCLGRCHAIVSEEEHRAGLTVCGNDKCEYKGQPFVKKIKCDTCDALYEENAKHRCRA